MAAAAAPTTSAAAPSPGAGSKHKASDAAQGATDAKQPPKKKRRTKQHVQPDDTIHPTGTPLAILEAQAAAAASGGGAPAAASADAASHGTAAASASTSAQASSTVAPAAVAAAMTDDGGTNGSAEHQQPPPNVQVHVHPPALHGSGSNSPTIRDSPVGGAAAAGAAAPAAGAGAGAAGTPKLETKKATKLRKKKEQKQAKTVATAVATAQAAAASASKAAANAAAAQAAAEKLVAAVAAAPAASSAAAAGPQVPTPGTPAAAAAGPKPKAPAALKRAEEKAQDKAKDQHEVATDQIKKKMSGLDAKVVSGDTFESENHFYPRVLNSNIHPMVANFLRLGNDRIAARYCHLNPKVKEDKLKKILAECPKVFRWSGADLFNVTTVSGQRQMIIVETNSCPSGQKSMPLVSEEETADGYHKLMRTTFLPTVAEMERKGELPKGGLAVIYDKNPMEASGYAAALAALSKEPVMLAEFYETDSDPPVKWIDGVTHIRDEEKKWHPMRACFRYVTQRPWNRIPTESKTLIFNPVVACLAGGRNKMAADKAYELFNHMIAETGLKIRTPETIRDVAKEMVPLWVASMGGHAVVKVPYSNAGQGVYTIVNDEELKSFMESPQRYDKYIVQSLVGNSTWSSITRSGQYFHAGTIPNKKCETFAADLRVMVAGGPLTGFTPVAVYARRAEKPLAHKLDHSEDSWAMLGTNLSVKLPDGGWTTETERLLLMDMKDFNRLGIGTDDLIDAYVQTVLATTAIDRLAIQLVKNQKFDFMLYRSLNSDESLLREIYLGHQRYGPGGAAAAAAAGAGAGAGAAPAAGAAAAAAGSHAPANAAGGASTTATHER